MVKEIFYVHNHVSDDYLPEITFYENARDLLNNVNDGFGAMSQVDFETGEAEYRLKLVTTHESGMIVTPMDALISEAQTITKIIEMLENIAQN